MVVEQRLVIQICKGWINSVYDWSLIYLGSVQEKMQTFKINIEIKNKIISPLSNLCKGGAVVPDNLSDVFLSLKR